MERVKKDIGRRLGLSWEGSEDMSSRACHIFNMLHSKKFLLLLDDIWERMELSMIGIPHPSPENKSKIIFTTRSELVCGLMEADAKIRIECLNAIEAWKLFQNKVGVISNDLDIQPLAEIVAKECGGLPLALTVIGRTMASKKTIREWKDAVTTLQKHAGKFTGMDKVFSVLKYSYDELADDSVRSCFLFCSLYPEDYSIDIESLVDQWIGKGYIIIGDYDEWEEAINTGYRIIGILKGFSLLETGKRDGYVKLHDVIRDMAHWIGKDKILVIPDVGFSEASRTEKLIKAQSISASTPAGVKLLGDKPDCPNATTLLFSCCNFDMPDDFFLLMPALKFVDISGIEYVPKSISKLVFLEYLSLIPNTFGVRVCPLPDEMKNMIRLKHLHLCTMLRLPVGVIGHLSNLQKLQLHTLPMLEEHMDGSETRIQDLGGLNKLVYLSITITNVKELECALKYQRLVHITYSLVSDKVNIFKLALSPLSPSSSLSCLSLGYMKRLKRLVIEDSPEMDELLLCCSPDDTQIPVYQSLEAIKLWKLPKLVVTWDMRDIQGQCFRNLRRSTLFQCQSMVNVTWLHLAPNLQKLDIRQCNGLKEIISDVSGACEEITFSRLRELNLNHLPNLVLICANVLPLHSLEDIQVEGCPWLRRLPLRLNDSPNNKLRSIQFVGSQDWWNTLEWENETTKSTFAQFFRLE